MKNPLNRSLWREFKQNLARYLSISIVLIVMISAVSGFLTVVYSVKDLLYKNQDECNVEDGQFAVTQTLNKDTKDKIEDLDLNLYENFYSEQDLSDDTMIRIYKNREKVDIATVYEGILPKNKHEIALDRLFAEKNDYKVGETIHLNGEDIKIVGFIAVPDYTSLIEKNNDLMMDAIHFGVAIVDNKTFDEFAEKNITYNYSYVLDKKDASDKENYDKLNDIRDICLENGYMLTNMMTSDMNQTISFLPNDMGGDIPMIKALLYIILVILAFIFVVISETIIDEESTVIGTLLASGYTKNELIRHYMVLPIIITIVSCIIGNIVGYLVFPPYFKDMYYGSYCLPPLKVQFIPEAFITTTIIPLVFMLVINYLMLRHKLNISPIRFLRRDTHKNRIKQHIKLKHGSFFRRFQIRVILQNKGSYFTLFIGILFASFILMFGIVMGPCIDNYLQNSEDSIKADYQYVLKQPVDIKNAEDAEKLTITSLETYYKAGDLDLDVSFYGLDNDSKYYDDISLPSKDDEITISYDFAQKMGLKKGDKITFTNPYTEKDYKFKVYDIYDYKAGFSAYMTQKNLNDMIDQDKNYYNAYLSDKKLDIKDEYIQSKLTRNDVVKIGEQVTSSFGQMIPIMTTVSIIIYLVVMYILTKLVMDRNATNMSFLKVMGYDDKEISKLYLKASAIVVVISLIICAPFSYYLMDVLFKFAFMRFTSYIEMYMPYYLHIVVFVVGLLVYSLVNFILNRSIKKVDLGESLKESE
ncbi:FtsX-like permease family protein [Intestinibacter sp.]|uniref:ABC transporter permease n=1 Tax=Intestinibacter sp. TaxID=1965304 RepID=UPI003AB3D3C4